MSDSMAFGVRFLFVCIERVVEKWPETGNDK